MNLDTLTLAAPDGTSVTLGALTTDAAGNRVGFTLDTVDMDPATRKVFQEDLPFVRGGLVAPGRLGVREVVVEGRILAATRQAVNVKRAELASVLGDHGDDLGTLRFDPYGTVVELEGVCEDVEFSTEDGHTLTYRASFICPDPLAYSTVATNVTLSGTPGTATTNAGDSTVAPTFTVTVASGNPTGIRVGNSTTGEHLELTGLTTVPGDVLDVTTRDGEQRVRLNGVSVMAKRTTASTWPKVRPGLNYLYVIVTAGGGTVSGTASYRAGWAA